MDAIDSYLNDSAGLGSAFDSYLDEKTIGDKFDSYMSTYDPPVEKPKNDWKQYSNYDQELAKMNALSSASPTKLTMQSDYQSLEPQYLMQQTISRNKAIDDKRIADEQNQMAIERDYWSTEGERIRPDVGEYVDYDQQFAKMQAIDNAMQSAGLPKPRTSAEYDAIGERLSSGMPLVDVAPDPFKQTMDFNEIEPIPGEDFNEFLRSSVYKKPGDELRIESDVPLNTYAEAKQDAIDEYLSAPAIRQETQSQQDFNAFPDRLNRAIERKELPESTIQSIYAGTNDAYTKELIEKKYPELIPDQGLEDPFFDPLPVIATAGASAGPGIAKKLGTAALTAAGEFATAPLQNVFEDTVLPNLPESARLPAYLAAGITTGTLANRASDAIAGIPGKLVNKIGNKIDVSQALFDPAIERQAIKNKAIGDKSQFYRERYNEQFVKGPTPTGADSGDGYTSDLRNRLQGLDIQDRNKIESYVAGNGDVEIPPHLESIADESLAALHYDGKSPLAELPTDVTKEKKYLDRLRKELLTQQNKDLLSMTAQPRERGVKLYSGADPGLLDEAIKLYDIPADALWRFVSEGKLPGKLTDKANKVTGGGYDKARNAIRKLLTPGFKDMKENQLYNELQREMKVGQAVGDDYAIDLGKRLQSLSLQDQNTVGLHIRNEGTGVLPKHLESIADETLAALYHAGKQAAEVGLLSEETFFKNAGRYMPRLYTSKEYDGLLNKYKIPSMPTIGGDRFKKRGDISAKRREAMGEILTPGYPVAKGLVQLTNDIKFAEFSKKILSNPSWAMKKMTVVGTADDGKKIWRNVTKDSPDLDPTWVQLKNKKFGHLDGAYVHPEIAAELNATVKTRSTLGKMFDKGTSEWKFWKALSSPSSHVANAISNGLLASMGGQSLISQSVYTPAALKDYMQGGEYWKLAKKEGLLKPTHTRAELGGMFDQVLREMGAPPAGDNLVEHVGYLGKLYSGIQQGIGGYKKGAGALFDIIEGTQKLSMFTYGIKKLGMAPREAAEYANKWLLDYEALTGFQKGVKRWLVPFGTFQMKAWPRVAETMIKTPWRLAPVVALQQGLEFYSRQEQGMTKDQQDAAKKLRNDWQKGGLPGMESYVDWPFVDDLGKKKVLNLSRYLPWGAPSFASSAGGVDESPTIGALDKLVSNLHFGWKEPISWGINQDLFTGKPIRDPKERAIDENPILGDIMAYGGHLLKTLEPTGLYGLRDIATTAYRGGVDAMGRDAKVGDKLLRHGLGFALYDSDIKKNMKNKVYDTKTWANEFASEAKNKFMQANDLSKRNPNHPWIERLRNEGKELLMKRQAMESKYSPVFDTYNEARGDR